MHNNQTDYKLYRTSRRDSDTRMPGCIVLVTVEFDGPDPQRQRDWVDAVFEALESMPERPAGSIAGHFHVSLDGTRVVNYAEWTDEAAHIAALGEKGRFGEGPKWDRVRNFPGLVSSRFKRYTIDG